MIGIRASDWLNQFRTIKRSSFGNAKKAIENSENIFGISKSFDIGKNVLGKFRKFGPCQKFALVCWNSV